MSMFEDLKEALEQMEAHQAGKDIGARIHPAVDVHGIRERLDLSQERFAATFGLSIDAVRNWEAGRRTPDPAAQALLAVIAHNPQAVINALAQSIPNNPVQPGKRGRPRKTAAA